jgi:uncharacterized repeat protein (TIGR02543 family)
MKKHINFRKTIAIPLIIMLLLALSFVPENTYGFDTGSGIPADPFKVMTVSDLKKVGTGIDGWGPDSSYLLMNDIVTPDDYDHIIPHPHSIIFTGTFDGGGNVITLSINRPDENMVGLFGIIGRDGIVKNLEVGGNITGNNEVGGIAGRNAGTIENCSISGNVNGSLHTGGVVGQNTGVINNCSTTGNVHGMNQTGGIAGYNAGIIENCHSTGIVSGALCIGGIAGNNAGGIVRNCYITGNVSGAAVAAGGIVGDNIEGTIESCFVAGNVTGNDSAGSIAGASHRGIVRDCFATGNVSGYFHVGGLVGSCNNSTVERCYTIGSVTAGDYRAGGVVGDNYNNGIVKNCLTLGKSLKGNPDVRRIVSNFSSGVLNNNYARTDMNIDPPVTINGPPDPNDVNGGNINVSSRLDYNRDFFETILGWDFDDTWYWDQDNFPKLRKIPITFLITFTVNFNADIGSLIPKEQIILHRENAIEPEEPHKEGFDFDGWYTTDKFTVLYDFNTPVINDLILYAKWTESNDVTCENCGSNTCDGSCQDKCGNCGNDTCNGDCNDVTCEDCGSNTCDGSCQDKCGNCGNDTCNGDCSDVACENCGSNTCDGSCKDKCVTCESNTCGCGSPNGGGGSNENNASSGSGAGGGGGSGGGNAPTTIPKEKDTETCPVESDFTYLLSKSVIPEGTKVNAAKTKDILIVDCRLMNFPAVKIQNYNYIKLRDFAMLLNGTSKPFGVIYNEKTRTVSITTGEPYIPSGGELEDLSEPINAIVSPHFIVLNDRIINLSAYLIEGYNYLRLQDLAIIFDVSIDSDHVRHTVIIELETQTY